MPEFFPESGPEIDVPATVLSAAWMQSQRGTWGIAIAYALDVKESSAPDICPGRIASTIWISKASANMAHKQLKSLGVDSDKVDARTFKTDPGSLLKGAECILVIFEEAPNAYHDTPEWKVKWINDRNSSLPDGVNPLEILQGREKTAKKKAPPKQTPIEAAVAASIEPPDDDVPF